MKSSDKPPKGSNSGTLATESPVVNNGSDVSYDFPQDNHFALPFGSHRLPSVTWVEHVEIEDKTPVHRLFRNLVYNGMEFGAQRWLADERIIYTLFGIVFSMFSGMCERLACLTVAGNSTRDLGG
ncbi:hypothetical protein S245_033322, partial [Arachis hypogaea]